MPDIGWQELLIIAGIAIIVVGPKELPLMMRTVGRWVARARGMAREFQRSMDDLAHETELDKLRGTIDGIRDPLGVAEFAIDGGISSLTDPVTGAPLGPAQADPAQSGLPDDVGTTSESKPSDAG